ncbi:membrane-associated ion-transporting ATPase [Ascobolus immersus RN42]|uniref:Membrane-associated ion-transporting ATPase n=1 Tax=Ascobolus immersus RN42 TaxID=1160509 RepID=A0A3N4IMJ4_ASCIM|nr:membrane-associated ion-transporting ATPase [Ascobolus immersus RN42]
MADQDMIEAVEPNRRNIRFDARNDRPSRAPNTGADSPGRSLSRRSSRVMSSDTMVPIEYRSLSIELDESARNAKVSLKKDNEAFKELAKIDWHTVSLDTVFSRLSTSTANGLLNSRIPELLRTYGYNKPTEPPSRLLRKLFFYFFGGFGPLLFVGGILVLICYKPLGNPPAIANLVLGVVLLMVFLVQAAFNAWQDYSSSRVMSSIKTMIPSECQVIRSGLHMEILTAEIVPGDVLLIKQGQKIPADLRLVSVTADLQFDRSILTGESKPVHGKLESTSDNYLETHCIALQGSTCINGSGTGICVATGDQTVFGRIAKLTSQPSSGLTDLQKEVLRFVLIIASLVFFVVVLVCTLWGAWLRKAHPNWIDVPLLIVDCVSVAVAFIPEGLPIALTACLTITAAVLKKNKILCKSLAIVETLGSVSVICSDKTGTLTMNEMTVTKYSIGNTEEDVAYTHNGFADLDLSPEHLSKDAVEQLHILTGLCHSARFDAGNDAVHLSERKIIGDATDRATLRFAEQGSSTAALREAWSTELEVPFNSKNKFMIKVVSTHSDEELSKIIPDKNERLEDHNSRSVLMIKGAPDILLAKCTHMIHSDGSRVELRAPTRAGILNVMEKWSADGMRVILCARKVVSTQTVNDIETLMRDGSGNPGLLDEQIKGLTVVGLLGIVDPLKSDIPFVIETLRRAGIRTFMVTGDAKATAVAIARQATIITTEPHLVHDLSDLEPHDDKTKDATPADWESNRETRSIALDGKDLIRLGQEQWDMLVHYDEIVFARTTPEQKLRIIKELQAREIVVGMTGDGVNDAPSLKAADIGIAVKGGSDIAIEAADMVLLDSFSAIVHAIEFGRLVFDNLKKIVVYLLPGGSFSEFWPVMNNVLFGLPQNLSSFLMIVICLFTDCAGAIALTYERPESDIMLRPPRRVGKDRLVNSRLILQAYVTIGIPECACAMAMSYWYMQRKGVPFGEMFLKYGDMPEGFDIDSYNEVLNVGSSIYFVTIVVMQWVMLFAVRTRRQSVFQQIPFFNKATENWRLIPAILFALVVSIFFLYVPFFQRTVGTTPVPVEYWFLPFAFGLGILLIDEARKWCARRWPTGLAARLAW